MPAGATLAIDEANAAGGVLGRKLQLTVYDDAGKPVYLQLVSLGADSATLRGAGGATQTVLLSALAKSWRGEFATLWRTPPAYIGRVPMGQNGPVVDWVAQQVARAQGEALPTTPGTRPSRAEISTRWPTRITGSQPPTPVNHR